MLYVQASEFLPDERVRELAGIAALDQVHHLTFSVDTAENSLGDLGRRLPALKHLRLDGSNVGTLRELGTGFSGLSVLWLARSSLLLFRNVQVSMGVVDGDGGGEGAEVGLVESTRSVAPAHPGPASHARAPARSVPGRP